MHTLTKWHNAGKRLFRSIRLRVVGAIAFAISCTVSCASPDVLLVPDGTPVQLAEPTSAHVYIVLVDGTRVKTKSPVTLPAGWWVAPVTDTPETETRPDASDTRTQDR